MKQPSNGDVRCNPETCPEKAEIDRLLRMAAYYQRLGCINVAVSLRALADAKRNRRSATSDGGESALAGPGADRPMRE